MTFNKLYAITSLIFILLLSPLCKPATEAETVKNPQFNEAAQLLAGKSISSESSLSGFTQSPYYITYSKQLEKAWNGFQKPNIEKIKTWWAKYAPSSYNENVLYPFSGPDIMNALTFFPESDTYVMFGLEHPGPIPAPHSLSNEKIIEGLNGLRNSLQDILHVNFFKTIGMGKDLGNNSFNCVTGLIMFFLATNDYEVVNVRHIAIDESSNVVPGKASDLKLDWANPPQSWIPGVEISFRKNKGKTQIVRYYMLNVLDEALTSVSKNFIPYLEKNAPSTTIIKSASYLMHNDTIKFTKIRAAILSVSDYILQDESGIPLRYFPEKTWKVAYHGFYEKPIPLFANRVQPELKKAMAEHSTGKLPFSYGYDYKPGESNLIFSKKKK